MKEKKLPAGLPPIPKGAVYIGTGPINLPKGDTHFAGWAWEHWDTKWHPAQNYSGLYKDFHYAVPANSPVLDQSPATQSLIQSPPWAIIRFDEKKQQWVFHASVRTRQRGRDGLKTLKQLSSTKSKFRIVRTSIPTK